MYECGPPALPVELEREIFHMSARSRLLSIPTFMLVAWRVKLWLEPVLYETILLSNDMAQKMEGHPVHSGDTLIPLLEQRPSFFRENVRNMLIRYARSFDDEKTILLRCRSVENLWLNQSDTRPDLISVVEDLPLKRLHCSLDILFGSPEKIDFTHRLFTGITHLQLFDSQMNPELYLDLASLPHLSHLSICDSDLISIAPKLLQTCHSLRILIFVGLVSCEHTLGNHAHTSERLLKDPRFVAMDCENEVGDWQRGSRTGIDYWSRAEDFVAKRRLGKVDAVQYRIEVDEN
ncbi:hypothetical protein B0H19DRAFT_1245453 [Mycena capillaripes]|nr:hypothetical protein B0H19DRAFT_1245453 [Mycena capillaripes]